MAKTELKTISISKIYPNFYQPREKFDKEKVKELAESILGNGLINPITVRKWTKGRYMIVAGERRWRAHKTAKLKQVDAFVKEYKNSSIWMRESLIENLHREDLNDFERGKYLDRLEKELNKELGKKITNAELGTEIGGIDGRRIGEWKDAYEIRKKTPLSGVKFSQIKETREISDEKLREKVLNKIEKDKIGESRPFVNAIKKATPEVEKALLDDKINPEQAERISKLKTETQRKKAIVEHNSIKIVEKNIEKNISSRTKAKNSRTFDKRLIQAKNWVKSFRGSVSDSVKQLDKTFKILFIATRFLPVMDDTQKERLQIDLSLFLDSIEKSKQLADKIEGYVDSK